MTKKDIEVLSNMIYMHLATRDGFSELAGVSSLFIEDLCTYLKKNPDFDKSRFLKACYGDQ